MDAYTERTRDWLDERFRRTDEDGVYFAHQPIYGFRAGHSEPEAIERYIRTYQILKLLGTFPFESLLDVGGAEGYKAHLARKTFGVHVESTDLSTEACRRAEEIFGVRSRPADIHELPFENGAFDVVLCSETLEHVADVRRALAELLRVAAKAVVITVPHEPQGVVERNVQEARPHAHINAFETDTFDDLREQGLHVTTRKLISPWLRWPRAFVEAMPKTYRPGRYPRLVVDVYNRLVPVTRVLVGKRAAAGLIRLDERLCARSSPYRAIAFFISKQPLPAGPGRDVSARAIVEFAVPFHYVP